MNILRTIENALRMAGLKSISGLECTAQRLINNKFDAMSHKNTLMYDNGQLYAYCVWLSTKNNVLKRTLGEATDDRSDYIINRIHNRSRMKASMLSDKKALKRFEATNYELNTETLLINRKLTTYCYLLAKENEKLHRQLEGKQKLKHAA